MGYQVYWDNGRFQGYGVTAYCDYPECKEKIDRGLGYVHEAGEGSPPSLFCCEKHKDYGLPEDYEPEEKEHPEWLNHILNDDSWEEWRKENPEIVKKYRGFLEEK